MENILAQVAEKVQDLLEDAKVYGKTVIKNNDTVMPGIVIGSEDSDEIHVRTCYYIDRMVNAGMDVDTMAETIVWMYKRDTEVPVPYVKNCVSNHETKNNLSVKIVNKRMNAERLKNIPYKTFLDFAVLVEVRVNIGDAWGSVTVDNEQIERWGMTFEEVFAIAFRNFHFETSTVCNIAESDLLKDLAGEPVLPMYIITNKDGCNGAVHMMNAGIFHEIAAKENDDILVLPSSVHEVFAIPARMAGGDFEAHNLMVRDINAAILAPEDVLSDHVYLYKRSGEWVY